MSGFIHVFHVLRVDAKHLYMRRKRLLFFPREINRFLESLSSYEYSRPPCFSILETRSSRLEDRVSRIESRLSTYIWAVLYKKVMYFSVTFFLPWNAFIGPSQNLNGIACFLTIEWYIMFKFKMNFRSKWFETSLQPSKFFFSLVAIWPPTAQVW